MSERGRERETEKERRLRESEAGVAYWKTGEGIDRRSELFAEALVTIVAGIVLAEAARTYGIKIIVWNSRRIPGVTCTYCWGMHGTEFDVTGYYPPIKAHAGCLCNYKPKRR